MKIEWKILMAPAVALAIGACQVEQTQEGEAPEVEPGQMPQYEVETPDVDMGWDTAEVRVPDVDVTTPGDTAARDTAVHDTAPRTAPRD